MTTQLIESYYRAFNAGDYAGMLALLADDVIHDINQGEREIGREAFAKFLSHMQRCYREQLLDVVVMADASQRRFAAEFLVRGTYLEGDPGFPAARGQSYELPAGAFFEVDGGAIRRVSTYYNLPDWLAQVNQP
jgi:steroid delta-isomerase-like uncharacterized protein